MKDSIGIFLLCLVCTFELGDALTCLNCNDVSDPRFCLHVTQCFAGEVCGMETFISEDGQQKYKLGCFDQHNCAAVRTTTQDGNFQSCHRCCSDRDLCNVGGCGSAGYPATRGPVCYSCQAFPAVMPCHVIDHCETDEVCYDEAKLMFQKDTLYFSGCRSAHNCDPNQGMPPVGRRSVRDTDTGSSEVSKRSSSVCTGCCHGDLCNVNCKHPDTCHDDHSCHMLMSNYDVCQHPDVAKQFCRKSCNHCTTSGACVDTATDCAIASSQTLDFCIPREKALAYGCMAFCGYCPTTTTRRTQTTTFPWTTTSPWPTRPWTQTTPHWATPPWATPPLTSHTDSTPAPYTDTTLGHTGTNSTTGYMHASTPTPGHMPLHVGDRVVRGPDWVWGDQDGHGGGTVKDVTMTPGYVRITWDNGYTNSYRMGAQGAYDLQLAGTAMGLTTLPDSMTTTIAATTTGHMTLHVGDRVVRGPDWNWDDQDGNGGGTVKDVTLTGWAHITWDNGYTNSYRMGAQGAYDLQLAGTAMGLTTLPDSMPTTIAATTTISTTVPTGSALAAMLHVGSRVVRGADWKWGTQDSNGPGTVTAITTATPGWFRVHWDGGNEQLYRMGAKGAYDLALAP